MEEVMVALLAEKDHLAELEKQIEESKQKLSQLATEAQSVNGGNASFKHGDKWYQVRRRGGKAFICEFDVPPGSWRKKNNNASS